ncbi:hypothetical protein HPB52_008589 [Rhipicephalus sanguineus]|uniref:Uncharacterized protein n=1 Tax=Rhipicephalus sanguineus TaxID=34632 RepID=A0A9D4Q970_RHISA|nr:hypothetical protein HPB52_008589 [Rhipicephalus sanguineus]
MPREQAYVMPPPSHLPHHASTFARGPGQSTIFPFAKVPSKAAYMDDSTAYRALQFIFIARHAAEAGKAAVVITLVIFSLTLTVALVVFLRGADDNDDDLIEVDRDKDGRTTKSPLPKSVAIPGVDRGAPGDKTLDPGTVTVPTTTPVPTLPPPVTPTPAVYTQRALKDVQDNDPDKKTVIAIGSLTYKPVGFELEYKQIIENVVNNFNADTVIAISSVSTMESNEECYAVPPNVLSSPSPEFPSLETHWPLVSANATYASDKTLVGLSFEMGTLLYILESEAVSLHVGAYAKCTDFGMTSREAICGKRTSTSIREQFLDEPYVVYGTFIDDETQKRIAFAEFFTSGRDKYYKAIKKYGSVRRRLAWMLFNVHLGDARKRCGSDAFTIVRLICQQIRGITKCG